MMRIGVFSDSHGDHESLSLLLEKMGYIDAACFLGDVSRDADYLREELLKLPQEPILYAVKGNNDYACMLPEHLLVEFEGKRIYLTHGHLFRSMMALTYRAKENRADVMMFGHTHQAYCEYADGVLLLNPGSAGNHCRGGAARACVLVIDRGRMRVEEVML